MSVEGPTPTPVPLPGAMAVAIGVAIVLLAAGVFAMYGSARSVPTVAGTTGALDCAALNSDASLNGTIAELYQGLANVSQEWSPGWNTTIPANASAYPSESAADQELSEAWSQICQSPAYDSLEQQWGANNVTGGLALNGSTGRYQVNFGIYWHAACTIMADDYDGYCQYSTTWYVDLVTGGIDGPLTSQSGGPPPGGGPPPAFAVGFTDPTNVSRGTTYWYNYTITYVDSGETFADVGVEVKTFGCANVTNVLAIEFVDSAGAPVASENLTTHSWGATANSSIASQDELSLESDGPLTGDELVLGSDNGEISSQIVPSNSEWEGCEF